METDAKEYLLNKVQRNLKEKKAIVKVTYRDAKKELEFLFHDMREAYRLEKKKQRVEGLIREVNPAKAWENLWHLRDNRKYKKDTSKDEEEAAIREANNFFKFIIKGNENLKPELSEIMDIIEKAQEPSNKKHVYVWRRKNVRGVNASDSCFHSEEEYAEHCFGINNEIYPTMPVVLSLSIFVDKNGNILSLKSTYRDDMRLEGLITEPNTELTIDGINTENPVVKKHKYYYEWNKEANDRGECITLEEEEKVVSRSEGMSR